MQLNINTFQLSISVLMVNHHVEPKINFLQRYLIIGLLFTRKMSWEIIVTGGGGGSRVLPSRSTCILINCSEL